MGCMAVPINDLLPLLAPEPCPICGAKVYITGVDEWESVNGRIVHFEHECETEPDIDSDEWRDWFAGHWSMPYVDWLPWETRVQRWLDERYFYWWGGIN